MKEKEIEKVFKALANKRRLLLLSNLKKSKEMSVGDLASEIKLSFRSTSKHLRILLLAEVVESQQRSKQIFYKITPEFVVTLKKVLSSL